MTRETVEPTVTIKHHGNTEERESAHPAFGQLQLSRYHHAGGSPLYGSDFMHSTRIGIRLMTSTCIRSLSSDRHHEGKVLFDVEMSEAQWATFIASHGVGGGVPCTIRFTMQDGHVPDLPLPDPIADFRKEAREHIDDVIKELTTLRADIEADTKNLSGVKRAALTERIDRAIQQIGPNLPFVAKVFGEHVERTVEKAKIEIAAHFGGMASRLGFEAIAKGDLPLSLPVPKDGAGDAES